MTFTNMHPYRHTTFSRHACERVVERLTMEPDEVVDLLDWGLAVKIGEEKGTRRIHRLFYSHDDHQCFIAIQDEKTRTIVTILPVDYYATLAWKIPKPSFEEAEKLVSCGTDAKPKTAATLDKDSTIGQAARRSFKITGTLMNLQKRPRFVNLGSWPAEAYDGLTSQLLQDTRFLQEMQSKLHVKRQPDEYVVGLVIRLGRKGEDVWVAVEDDGTEQVCPMSHG